MHLSLQAVAEATGGHVLGADRAPSNLAFASYHTDSREVAQAGLFFALSGAETDGHRFLAGAFERGAAGAVVDRDVAVPEGRVAVRVQDTWHALAALARYVQDLVRPVTIGVTGSNGKTSTKELLAAALAAGGPVHRTAGNLNTETGLPLTMLGLEAEHRFLVLEMGMQGPGEIAHLAALARPTIGVITGIGTVHLEFFASQEDLARAKGELVAALPRSGRAILPAGSPYLELLRSLTVAPVRTFGTGGDVQPAGYAVTPEGCSFRVGEVGVRLALAGRHMVQNACAALAAAEAAGVEIAQGAPALAAVRIGGRLEEHRAHGGFTVVDDSYNASPESMLAAFATLAERARSGRLLGVLGEMRELGAVADAAHDEVGGRAADVFDELCVVAEGRGRRLAAAAGAALVGDAPAAADWVRERARPGDVVLVKASHGVHLEEVVRALLQES